MKITDHGPVMGSELAAMEVMEVEGIDIAAWCPDAHAQEKPEQVHLRLDIKDQKAGILIRFKSPRTLDILIEQLTRYRKQVWPI